MHGREGEEKKRRRQHMWPVPAPGGGVAAATSFALPPPQPVSTFESPSDSFLKCGRKIRVGDCALFQAGNAQPFIGIIRRFTRCKEDYLKLCVNWLYRPADIKLSKGILLDSAPNEVFYSFHKDVIPAASLLHPCQVAFLQKSAELPPGVPSFVCRRVYDIASKRLWWLTDQDYINEHQEEVERLLNKTRLEMYAAAQSGGHSLKSQNTPASAQQLKSSSDTVQNSGTSFPSQIKGKKMLRNDQVVDPIRGDKVVEPAKRDQVTEPIKREHSAKPDDGDSMTLMFDNIKAEIAKVTENGGLVSTEGVEKLVNLMRLDRTEKKFDFTGRILLADVIAATDRYDCLDSFVQLRGVPVLDDWLQEVHKRKTGDGSSPRESDKVVDDFLSSLLRALERLPVNLNALQTCNVGKSVNNLRSHKNLEIQKKARSLVDTWKKRVDAEMSQINDAKSDGFNQPLSLPVKPGSDVTHAGNKRTGPIEVAVKMPHSRASTCKALLNKPGASDSTVKSILASSVVVSSKDPHCKTAAINGGSESPPAAVKEENSSGSSQFQNNSQSCSSDQAKTMSSAKEDARSSTARSMNSSKLAGGSSQHRRSNNSQGTIMSVIQKEPHSGRFGSVNKVMTSEKASQSGQTCEKPLDMPVTDHVNSNRLIVRLPNPGRSPGHSASGGSFENLLVTGSSLSSPGVPDKQDHNDSKIKHTNVSQSYVAADANIESWQDNDIKEGLRGAEGVRLPTDIVDEARSRNVEDTEKVADPTRTASSSPGNENGAFLTEIRTRNSFSSINSLIESCAWYYEASTPLAVGDEMGMNLLATVAAREISNSDLISPTDSAVISPPLENPCTGNDESKFSLSHDDDILHRNVQHDEAADGDSEMQGKSVGSVLATDLPQQEVTNFTGDNRNAIQLQDNKLTGNSMVQSNISYMRSHIIVDSCMNIEINPAEKVDRCSSVSKPAEVEAHNGEEASPLEDEGNTRGQVSDIYSDDIPKLRSPSMDVNKSFECNREKNADGSMCTTDVKIGDRCDLHIAASGKKLEKPLVEETTLSFVVEEASGGACPTDQQQQPTSSDALDESVDDVVSLVADSVPSSEAADESKTRMSDNYGIDHLDLGYQAKQKNSISSSSIIGPAGLATVSPVTAEIVGDLKEAHESSPAGPTTQELSSTSTTEKTENHAKSICSNSYEFDADGREELASSAEPCSLTVPAEPDVSSKFEFDLNEGIPGDDGNQGQSATSASKLNTSAIHLPSLSSIANAISNGLPASITVAAPGKGPFIPPEKLLKTKGEAGWKGSAATSAFRPAEPRKILEMPPNISDIPSADFAGKQGRPLLGIDLNIADERVLEDMTSQSSTQTRVSISGIVNTYDVPTRTAAGVDLDLNRADDGLESVQFLASTSCRLESPLLPTQPASGAFPGGDVNILRNFDLNDRPGLDEVGVDPVPRSQQANNTSNVPFLAPVAGRRTNNSEFGCASSWFHPNSCPTLAIPSLLPDRVEQFNPTVAAPASQRILGSVIGGGNSGSDIYRSPVLSSSTAMVFSPATAFSYARLPFASTSFSGGSTPYVDSSSGGGSCLPAFPSLFVGPAGAVSSHYPRPYLISFPEGSTSSLSDNLKWSRQGLDLNTGPGGGDMEGKDERLPSASRQLLVATSQAFMEEQARIYSLPSVGLKRKEPEGSWDADRSTDRSAKQLSWR